MISAHMDMPAKQVVIAVDDDGPGLPANAREVVFQIGQRLDERVPGSGLGLPIVRDLARLYGGEVRLQDSPLGGLRTELRLPAPAHGLKSHSQTMTAGGQVFLTPQPVQNIQAG
jgi:signal transduction histidine kinase